MTTFRSFATSAGTVAYAEWLPGGPARATVLLVHGGGVGPDGRVRAEARPDQARHAQSAGALSRGDIVRGNAPRLCARRQGRSEGEARTDSRGKLCQSSAERQAKRTRGVAGSNRGLNLRQFSGYHWFIFCHFFHLIYNVLTLF